MHPSRARFAGSAVRPAFRFVAVTLLGTALLLAVAVGASASTPLDDRRGQAQGILADIQKIDEEVGAAAERFNGANYELQQLTAELSEARRDLTRARELQRVAQRRLAERLRVLYMRHPTSTIDVILGATSLSEMVDEIELSRRFAEQDSAIVSQVEELRKRVETRKRELAIARKRQAAIVAQRAAERSAIEARLAERRRLLVSVEEEIARLEEVERRQQVELRREAEAALERQRRAEEQPQASQPADWPSAQVSTSAGDGAAASGPSGGTPPPPDAERAARVVAIAMQYLGVPYKWGGASPETGFDCSGLTMYVYAKIGIRLPHYAAAQYQMGAPVARDALYAGDLVFFNALGHVGMYIGGGNFIHAPKTGDVVKISPLSDPYYVANWVGARRLL